MTGEVEGIPFGWFSLKLMVKEISETGKEIDVAKSNSVELENV